MDGKKQVLVGGGSDHVCCSEELPVKHGSVAEEVCTGKLEGNDAEDDIFGEGLRAAELCNLIANVEVSNRVQGLVYCLGVGCLCTPNRPGNQHRRRIPVKLVK